MTEKVKITRDQAEAIEYLKSEGYPTHQIVKNALNENWCNEPEESDVNIELLNGMDPEALVFAIHGMYEVEPEYKVGEYIVYENEHLKNTMKIVLLNNEYITVEPIYEGFEGCNKVGVKSPLIRHATPEEIKFEKERRWWAKQGREPGEFRNGDLGRFKYSSDISTSAEILSGWYSKGNIAGFFPAESFIEFGGADE